MAEMNITIGTAKPAETPKISTMANMIERKDHRSTDPEEHNWEDCSRISYVQSNRNVVDVFNGRQQGY